MDRVDFIIPFFPIKDFEPLVRILDLQLKRMGWDDCPAEVRTHIVEQAQLAPESVRPLQRLARMHRTAVRRLAANNRGENKPQEHL